MANISKQGIVTATGITNQTLVDIYDTEHDLSSDQSESRSEDTRSNMFEIDDICKIHKAGNIQSYQFIEF